MTGITSSAACAAGDKKAYLHQLNNDGSVDENPLASVDLDFDYSFQFTNLFTIAPTAKYFIKVDACGKKLSRPVTGMENQIVNYTTSLVGLVPYVQVNGVKKLQDLSSAELEAVISTIANTPNVATSESMSEVYDSLTAGSGATQSAQVVSTFGLNAITDFVSMVPPYIDTLTAPTAYNEMSSASHTVTAAHWYGSYSAAYEWILNGNSDGNSATYAFTPTKNSQGMNILRLKIGTDDGGGLIDSNYAVFDQEYSVNILNTFPAIAPTLSLTSAAVTNSTATTVSIATGALLANCDTFSTFALSESATSSGVAFSDFTRSCTTAAAQPESYTLSMGDGIKTVYLWAKDGAGNISTTATSINVTYDTTPPVLSLTVPTATQASSAMSLAFTASDVTSSVAVLKLQYSLDNTTYSDVAILTAATSPYTGYTPAASGYLRLYSEDAAGNSTTTTPAAFVFDNTPPNAPVATLTTATLTNNPVVALTVADCTDTATLLITETAGAPSASNPAWAACAATPVVHNYTVVGEGTHTLYIWAKDVAGNISATSDSKSIVLDTTPPVITWVTPTTDQKTSVAATVTWRVTDIHTSTSQNTVLEYSENAGANYSVISTQALPAGSATNQTYNATWNTAATLKTVKLKVTVTDAAANQTVYIKDLIVESERPVINTLTIADGAAVVGLASVNAQLAVTPSTSATSYMRISETDFDVNTDNDVGWMPFSSDKFSFSMANTPGTHTVYAQIKNNAGIMSLTKSVTLKLDTGNPPSIKVTSPSGSGTYLPGNVMPITWQCTSNSADIGLATKPISSIQYTIDDGLSYFTIVDDTTSNLPASGTYNWTIPATTPAGATISASTPIRVLVACKTAGGVITTSLSAIQNSAWQILVGDPGNLETGVHISAADISNSSGVFGDAQNNLYSGSRLRHAITKIDRQTGLITEWLGDMFVEGCPTNSVAKFITPRIIDITGDTMTIVSTPCHTITRIKISDKSIIWNRTVPLLTGDDRLANSGPSFDQYLKSGYYYFPSLYSDNISANGFYELDLNNTSSTPKLIIGNTAMCTDYTPTVSASVFTDDLSLPCKFVTSPTSRGAFITVMPDRSKIFVWWRTAANQASKLTLIQDSATQRYNISAVTGSASDGDASYCSRGVFMGSDTSKIFCMQNARSGRDVTYMNTSTGTTAGVKTTLATDTIDTIQVSVGSSDKAVYIVSRETNELFEVKFNTTLSSTKIGGNSFLTFGNGTDPSQVAFTSIAGLGYEYDSGTKVGYLYTRGIRHLRRIKLSVPSGGTDVAVTRVDTAYSSSLNATLNTFGTIHVAPDRSLAYNGLDGSSRYTWATHDMSAWSVTGNANYGISSTIYTGTMYDWGWTGTYLPDNSFYFTAYSDTNLSANLKIFKANGGGAGTVAAGNGTIGTSTVSSATDATTVPLKRIYGMQPDKDGNLLVFDADKIRKIVPGSPATIIDVMDLTAQTNYPTGRVWIDAVYNNDNDDFYMVANNIATGITEVFSFRPGVGFQSISVSGLNLPGTLPGSRGKAFVLKITPMGLVMQDSYKRRILVTPLLP
ncbi:hypothetical protein DOM22_04890 [Bdellovibrio sp. ZAP7]|uniref:hypothetical protein n=1 Tax=Bdellovibrio sp. ZAP7 TaxID=2231053 RepID=UPI0011624463|nr:hypothetical protein [Bdellovibrio sp. ZAP7]QDK44540.1 hypothetical protein DOM22_04890 [Bdellovibrio sp. ZAP7]